MGQAGNQILERVGECVGGGARFSVEEGLASLSSSGCVIALTADSVALFAIEVSREFTCSAKLSV